MPFSSLFCCGTTIPKTEADVLFQNSDRRQERIPEQKRSLPNRIWKSVRGFFSNKRKESEYTLPPPSQKLDPGKVSDCQNTNPPGPTVAPVHNPAENSLAHTLLTDRNPLNPIDSFSPITSDIPVLEPQILDCFTSPVNKSAFTRLTRVIHQHYAEIRFSGSHHKDTVSQVRRSCDENIVIVEELRDSQILKFLLDSPEHLSQREKKQYIKNLILNAESVKCMFKVEKRFGGVTAYHNIIHSLGVALYAVELCKGIENPLCKAPYIPSSLESIKLLAGWAHDSMMVYSSGFQRKAGFSKHDSEGLSSSLVLNSIKRTSKRLQNDFHDDLIKVTGDLHLFSDEELDNIRNEIKNTVPCFSDFSSPYQTVSNDAELTLPPCSPDERKEHFAQEYERAFSDRDPTTFLLSDSVKAEVLIDTIERVKPILPSLLENIDHIFVGLADTGACCRENDPEIDINGLDNWSEYEGDSLSGHLQSRF